jgi:hypothetical protein
MTPLSNLFSRVRLPGPTLVAVVDRTVEALRLWGAQGFLKEHFGGWGSSSLAPTRPVGLGEHIYRMTYSVWDAPSFHRWRGRALLLQFDPAAGLMTSRVCLTGEGDDLLSKKVDPPVPLSITNAFRLVDCGVTFSSVEAALRRQFSGQLRDREREGR